MPFSQSTVSERSYRCEPVDVEHAHRATTETDDAGKHVLVRGGDEAASFGEDALHLLPKEEAHDIDVVRGEVVYYTHIADAVGEWANAACPDLEDGAALALIEPLLERLHGRVEALDVSDGEDNPGALGGAGDSLCGR